MIRGFWWKIAGVILVLYSLVFGMCIPLTPGIVKVGPQHITEGESLELTYGTYNINYDQLKEASEIKAWLKIDDERILRADRIEVKSATEALAHFQIPNLDFDNNEVLPASLIISDPVHGYAILPSAIFIREDKQLSSGQQQDFDDLSAIDDREGLHFPFRSILHESIRNTYYHVPLWFAMVILFAASAYYSSRFLQRKDISADKRAVAFAEVGTLFGILGFFTGAIWAKYTWGAFWSWDIKQFTSAVALLIYLAYFVLRSSVQDHDKRARFTASYNIFAFIMLIPLIFIVPRMTDSLHPGSGGNPALGGEDLDNTMRMIFYPAIVGWILLGYWISTLRARFNKLEYDIDTDD